MAHRPVSFGISVTPYAADHARLIEQVLAAERGGLELVGIQDHPYQRRFLDTFQLIGDLLARTHSLRFFPDVASLPMRPPAMLAKAAVSLDVMSGGRFEMGLGAGAFWDAIVGMGGPRRTPGESLAALEEAIHILRAVFEGERVVRGPGPHYAIPGYPQGPPAAHRIEIWVGAYKRRALGLIGRLADGWVPSLGSMPPPAYRRARDTLDEVIAAAGRQPADVRRLYNIGGTITDGARGDGPLDGPVDLWVQQLSEWAGELDVDTFVFWPPDSGARQVDLFAAEVVPAVRRAVGPLR